MSEAIQHHANRFPSEIRKAVEGIDGDVEQAIVVLLTNEEDLAFSELEEKLEIHQQTLSNALEKLQRGGLVHQRSTENDDSPYSAYYTVSEFGERFVESLFHALGNAEQPKYAVGPSSHGEIYVEAANVMGDHDPALVEMQTASESESEDDTHEERNQATADSH